MMFVVARMFTRAFWTMVFVSFVGILMLTARNYYRTQIYQAAAETIGKRFPSTTW